ncbi:MAG: DoxX family protein [Stellaceae bacterium]
MYRVLDGFVPLLGRVLIALLFVPSGLHKLGAYHETVGHIAHQGLPLPAVGYLIAVAAELPLALMLLVGLWTRPAAALLALYTLATAVFFHDHLAEQMQAINFFKNLAIAGGLLFAVSHGAGSWSVDRLLAKRR